MSELLSGIKPDVLPEIPEELLDILGAGAGLLWTFLGLLLAPYFLYEFLKYRSSDIKVHLVPVSVEYNGRVYMGVVDLNDPNGHVLGYLYRPYILSGRIIAVYLKPDSRFIFPTRCYISIDWIQDLSEHVPYNNTSGYNLRREIAVLAPAPCLDSWRSLNKIINLKVYTGDRDLDYVFEIRVDDPVVHYDPKDYIELVTRSDKYFIYRSCLRRL